MYIVTHRKGSRRLKGVDKKGEIVLSRFLNLFLSCFNHKKANMQGEINKLSWQNWQRE